MSCNQSTIKKVNENNLKTYFKAQIKKLDSSITLETFTFVKLDTITLKNQFSQLYNGMLAKSRKTQREIATLLEKVKSNRQLQSLSNGLSATLYKNYKEDADDDLAKAKEMLLQDSLLRIDFSKVDTILLKVDSTKPVAYLAKCFYLIKQQDLLVSKDTAYITMDIDYNIVNNEEYYKQLNQLFRPASGFKYE